MIEARCKHFGLCGGCRWQHWQYDEQLAYKEKEVARAFHTLSSPARQVWPIVPSDPPWEYRNKMEWTFSQDLAGRRFLGLFLKNGRRKVLDVESCFLVAPWFSEALEGIRSWWVQSGLSAYVPSKDLGALRTCTMRHGIRTGDRLIMVSTSGNPDEQWSREQAQSLVEILVEKAAPSEADAALSVILQIHQAKKGQPTQFFQHTLHGPGTLREILEIQYDASAPSERLLFTISPSAFFQPNTKQAENIYSRALQLADFDPDSVIYDLYCGTGTFALCAAKKGSRVLGIDLCCDSIADARNNAKINELEQAAFLQGDVGKVLTQIAEEGSFPRPDGVILDPPRSGLDARSLEQVLRLSPEKILYVSCNPSTQVENIRTLLVHGYRLEARQAIDAFPHTPHIENIAFLVKE